MARVRVLIADDHTILRAGLRMLIGAQSDMEVVGEAADGPEALRNARTIRPDVVLLDLSMPGSKGMETIEQLVRLEPAPRVLVLTMHDDPAYLQSALQAGASGYIVKKAADVDLLIAIRAVQKGRLFVDLTRPGQPAPEPAARRGARDDATPRPKLSPRESEVIRLLAQGFTNREAAEQLKVSVKTLETYRKRLSDKLRLKSRAQLFRFAVASGLLGRDADLPGQE